MRIIHINNTANVAWRLAEAQRRLGHEAKVLAIGEQPYGFRADLAMRGRRPTVWNLNMLAKWRYLQRFDVLHVHGGIWRFQFVLPMFKKIHRRNILALHFHGSEVRSGRGLHFLDSADAYFLATPDLFRGVSRGQWIPNPIDLPALPRPSRNPIPRFGHFPSHPDMKGTDTILHMFREAFGPCREFRDAGVHRFVGEEAELWVVSDTPHDQVVRVMEGCDVVIDQYTPSYGAYGYVGIEAMALGKPVLCSLRPELYPACPILPLDRDGPEQLRRLASDEALRLEKGREAREYVALVHESGRVARQVLRAYYETFEQPPPTPKDAVSYWKRRGRSYADEFQGAKVEVFRAQHEELRTILDTLEFNSVGEVGCGFGRISGHMEGPWVGADLSRDQLLRAAKVDRLRGSLLQAAAHALPFRDSSFDLALSTEMLMHVPPSQIRQALSELSRVAQRYIVHLDWFEDYLVGHATGWCWVHDYTALWRSLGLEVREYRLKSTGIQSVFVVDKAKGNNGNR